MRVYDFSALPRLELQKSRAAKFTPALSWSSDLILRQLTSEWLQLFQVMASAADFYYGTLQENFITI